MRQFICMRGMHWCAHVQLVRLGWEIKKSQFETVELYVRFISILVIQI